MIELNEASVNPRSYRPNARQNAYRMLEACEKHGAYLLVSSDAHIERNILNHQYALEMLDETGFDEKLVVNTSAELLRRVIADKK